MGVAVGIVAVGMGAVGMGVAVGMGAVGNVAAGGATGAAVVAHLLYKVAFHIFRISLFFLATVLLVHDANSFPRYTTCWFHLF
jgi:hypothetical protein